MKKVLHVIFVIGILWIISGCSSIPKERSAYTGAEKPKEELSHFYMEEDWFVNLVLFKIDGKTCPDFYPKSVSYTDWKGGFNVSLLPGNHIFELILHDDEFVDTISFTMESGADYEFRKKGKDINVFKKTVKGDKAIDVKRVRLNPYVEPNKSGPHGVLVQNDETKKEGYFQIVRIDGLPGPEQTAFWSSVFPIKTDEKYEIKLTPGKHIIEYTSYINVKGTMYFSQTFSSKKITIESGKKYKLRFSNLENFDNKIFNWGAVEFVTLSKSEE